MREGEKASQRCTLLSSRFEEEIWLVSPGESDDAVQQIWADLCMIRIYALKMINLTVGEGLSFAPH